MWAGKAKTPPFLAGFMDYMVDKVEDYLLWLATSVSSVFVAASLSAERRPRWCCDIGDHKITVDGRFGAFWQCRQTEMVITSPTSRPARSTVIFSGYLPAVTTNSTSGRTKAQHATFFEARACVFIQKFNWNKQVNF